MEKERKKKGERKGIVGGKKEVYMQGNWERPFREQDKCLQRTRFESQSSHSRVKGREGAIDQFKDTFLTCPELQGSYRDLTPNPPR
jgi:hypothetical protein